MATIPTNPSDGDTFTDGVGVTWTYNSSSNKWLIPVATAGGGGGSGWGSTAAPTSVTGSYTASGPVTFVARSYTTATFVGANAPTPSVTNNSGNAWTSLISQGGRMQSSINTPTVVIGYADATDVITASQIDYWDA